MEIREVLALMREKVEREGGVAAWARGHSVSEQYARDVLAQRRSPGPGILEPLGLTRVTVTYWESPSHD